MHILRVAARLTRPFKVAWNSCFQMEGANFTLRGLGFRVSSLRLRAWALNPKP